MGPSRKYINAHRDDSYPPMKQSQHQQTAIYVTLHSPRFILEVLTNLYQVP